MLEIYEIKPLYNNILTTGDRYEEDEVDGGLIVNSKGDLKLYQTVIEVGSTVRDIKVGDTVMIDPRNYMVMKYDPNSLKNDMDMNKVIRYNFPWVTLKDKDGKSKDCLYLSDRDIKFVFKGKEVRRSIIIPEQKLIID